MNAQLKAKIDFSHISEMIDIKISRIIIKIVNLKEVANISSQETIRILRLFKSKTKLRIFNINNIFKTLTLLNSNLFQLLI